MDTITQARADLLNAVLRGLTDLYDGRGVTLLLYDPARMDALRAAGTAPRTLLR